MALTIKRGEDQAQDNPAREKRRLNIRFVPANSGSKSTKTSRSKVGTFSGIKFEGIEGVEVVRQGEDVAALEALKTALVINDSELAHVVGVSERTLDRRRQLGRLEPRETDRIATLFSVLDDAVALFEGDEEKARRWMRTPVRGLGNQTPLALLDTEAGSRIVRDVIGRLEHGVL